VTILLLNIFLSDLIIIFGPVFGGQVTITDKVKLRLREMGHYDVIPLGKIMGRGEEE